MILDFKVSRALSPLLGPARYKGAHGGRGSGKSHFFAERCIQKSMSHPGTRIVCAREVQKSLKESVKLLLEDKIEAKGLGSQFDVLHDRIVTPGDGLIIFSGLQDHTAESVKSLEGFDVAYMEEAQTISQRSLELLRPTIRTEGSELWFSWNPKNAEDPVDKFLRGVSPPKDAIVAQANWRDNPFFPDVLEGERLDDLENNPDRYDHIWEGGYEPQAIGAIWNRANLHAHRRTDDRLPTMKRVVVAIDPQGKKGLQPGDTDDTGIVVVGLGIDGRGYVLADATLNDTPAKWARRALSVFDQYDGDALVVEINYGGEMVKHTLISERPGVRVVEVTATRGKHVRAEPISSLYEQGLVSHVGTHLELENELCLFTPYGYEGNGSPNRADALVWGLTELFPRIARKKWGQDRGEPRRNDWVL